MYILRRRTHAKMLIRWALRIGGALVIFNFANATYMTYPSAHRDPFFHNLYMANVGPPDSKTLIVGLLLLFFGGLPDLPSVPTSVPTIMASWLDLARENGVVVVVVVALVVVGTLVKGQSEKGHAKELTRLALRIGGALVIYNLTLFGDCYYAQNDLSECFTRIDKTTLTNPWGAGVVLLLSGNLLSWRSGRYHPGREQHNGNVYNTRWTCCGARTTSYHAVHGGMEIHDPPGCVKSTRILLLGYFTLYQS